MAIYAKLDWQNRSSYLNVFIAVSISVTIIVSMLMALVPLHGSAAVTVQSYAGLSYGPGSMQKADVYIPANGNNLPAVILIHGGGFRQGNRDQGNMLNRADKVVKSGMVAISIDYTLGTNGSPSYPAAVDDVTLAIQWAKSQASIYKIDPDRIGLWGFSAGGTLATTAGQGQKAIATWSAPLDFGTLPETFSSPAPESAVQDYYIGCSKLECPEIWQAADPIQFASDISPAHFLVNSTNEFIVIENLRNYRDVLLANGRNVTTIELPGTTHENYQNTVYDGRKVIDHQATWFKNTL